MMHARQSFQIVQCVLSVQSGLSRVKRDETAALRLASALVFENIELVDASVLVEHLNELGLFHSAWYLTDEHFYRVRVGLTTCHTTTLTDQLGVVVALKIGDWLLFAEKIRRIRIDLIAESSQMMMKMMSRR